MNTPATEAASTVIQLPHSAVYTATGAIVVASIAICVNIWLNFRSHKIQNKRDEENRYHEFKLEEQKLILEKLELLYDLISESYDWTYYECDKALHKVALLDIHEPNSPPLIKAHHLASIYFPELLPDIRTTLNDQQEYIFLLEESQKLFLAEVNLIDSKHQGSTSENLISKATANVVKNIQKELKEFNSGYHGKLNNLEKKLMSVTDKHQYLNFYHSPISD